MKTYKFYKDVKCTVWVREYYQYDANSKEAALQHCVNDSCHKQDGLISDEILDETLEDMTKDENLDQATEIIFDGETDEELYNNDNGVSNDIFSNFPKESV